MNSFSTRDDSLAALARARRSSTSDVPPDFVQNKEPKLLVDDLMPVEWPRRPGARVVPARPRRPLHGAADLGHARRRCSSAATATRSSSNSDNLGAVLEPRILAWIAREEIPFVMEVTDRTEADRKGGHIARRREDGRLVLRETAQTPEEDLDALQDISRHRYVNTNNLWVDLRALDAAHARARRRARAADDPSTAKTVDPSDKSSPAVFQLETAMGAAIGVFEGARALRVPRTRFAPVKTTDDLLALRSDAYVLDRRRARRARRASATARRRSSTLDDDYFKLLRDFDARFPAGAPSLVECERLAVEGDVHVRRATSSSRGERDASRGRRRSRTGRCSRGNAARGPARVLLVERRSTRRIRCERPAREDVPARPPRGARARVDRPPAAGAGACPTT